MTHLVQYQLFMIPMAYKSVNLGRLSTIALLALSAACESGSTSDCGGGDGGGGGDGRPPIGTGDIYIVDMGLHEISYGEVFHFTPDISGDVVLCRKDLGHDDVVVDSETGEISWDTSGLAFGRGFHTRIKCSNYAG